MIGPTVPDSDDKPRPEVEIILLAARGCMTGLEDRFHSAATRAADWPRVERFADWHGITPLLHHHLSEHRVDSVPPDVLARLRDSHLINHRRALLQAGELIGVLGVLKSNGIDAIAFKGPVLAASLYEKPALRVAGDVDLLIKPEDAVAARRALLEAGYRAPLDMSPEQDKVYRQSSSGYAFNSPHHQTIIDLQWRISPGRFSFNLPLDRFWSRADRIHVRGVAVPTFAPRDLLLVLCIHGGKHAWESLKWLVDVAELLKRNPEIDFDALFAESGEAGCRRAVLLGLFLAATMLDAPLPESIRERAESDSAVRWMAGQIESRTFDSAPEREGKYRIEVRLEDSALKQARYVWRRLLTPAFSEWESGSVGPASHLRRAGSLARYFIRRKRNRST